MYYFVLLPEKVEEDVATTMNFYVNYRHNVLALVSRWMFLWAHTLLWSGLAVGLMRRKDEI